MVGAKHSEQIVRTVASVGCRKSEVFDRVGVCPRESVGNVEAAASEQRNVGSVL